MLTTLGTPMQIGDREQEMNLPMLTVDLIKMLDKRFPDKCPNINAPDRQVWFDAGARSVVNLLLRLQREQEENNKPKEIL